MSERFDDSTRGATPSVSLAVTGAKALTLKWDDGQSAQVNLAEVIADHPGLRPIRAAKAFAKAALSKDGRVGRMARRRQTPVLRVSSAGAKVGGRREGKSR